MTCPYCRSALSLREYAWTHRHQSDIGRLLGLGLMAVGAASAAAGIVELFRA